MLDDLSSSEKEEEMKKEKEKEREEESKEEMEKEKDINVVLERINEPMDGRNRNACDRSQAGMS